MSASKKLTWSKIFSFKFFFKIQSYEIPANPWNRRLTGAADLRRAAAATVTNDGHHPRAEAGASLLAAAAHRAQRRVWLAAVCALLGVDLSAHAGTLQHAAAHGRSHLPTGERRRSVTLWPGVFDRCCY